MSEETKSEETKSAWTVGHDDGKATAYECVALLLAQHVFGPCRSDEERRIAWKLLLDVKELADV